MKLRHIKRKTCARQRRPFWARIPSYPSLLDVWEHVKFLSDALPYIKAINRIDQSLRNNK